MSVRYVNVAFQGAPSAAPSAAQEFFFSREVLRICLLHMPLRIAPTLAVNVTAFDPSSTPVSLERLIVQQRMARLASAQEAFSISIISVPACRVALASLWAHHGNDVAHDLHVIGTRPRVYSTDFEVAVKFPSGVPFEECRVSGYPTGGSYPEDTKLYARPVPPEIPSGIPYDPFKLDVWQFGTSLSDFKSSIPSIDRILEDLRLPDAAARPSSFDALRAVSKILADMTPNALMIPPEGVSRQNV
ncbi:hypothetical protein NUW54_g6824 [Trametes sanguinea]|uniref:Uncharacterized protein n=1 Tax=Trametes sanguinea TaxID=158606 RepID=A0ACC1PR46_9APHY|nr:hypothetical protein NUW54_g6824 [Trametes sanguinea]